MEGLQDATAGVLPLRPSYPGSPSAAAGAPVGSFWGPPLGPPCSEVTSAPVSDWGSPAQQWGPPRGPEADRSSSKLEAPSPSSHIQGGAGKTGYLRTGKGKEVGPFAPLLHFEGPHGGTPGTRSRCPRTPLSADSFVSSPALWYSSHSSEDEADDSGTEEGEALPPLSNDSPICCTRKIPESGSPFVVEGRGRRETASRERTRGTDGFSVTRNPLIALPPQSRRAPSGATFCLRPNANQQPLLLSPSASLSSEPLSSSSPLDIWGDSGEPSRPGKAAGGGPTGYRGGRWRDTASEETRHALCSNNHDPNTPHQPTLGIAAVPVRTRKGFRKPLPLPPEMLAAIAAAGPRRPIDPVLQYDGESREWR